MLDILKLLATHEDFASGLGFFILFITLILSLSISEIIKSFRK